jgi:hypothetical protein
MSKEFIPYTEALALKELGFDEPCIYYVNKNNEEFIYNFEIHPDEFIYRCGGDIIKTPLYQQAFRWFREKYQLDNAIMKDKFIIETDEDLPKWYYGFHTYEEAELACLKKLIEIVKI